MSRLTKDEEKIFGYIDGGYNGKYFQYDTLYITTEKLLFKIPRRTGTRYETIYFSDIITVQKGKPSGIFIKTGILTINTIRGKTEFYSTVLENINIAHKFINDFMKKRKKTVERAKQEERKAKRKKAEEKKQKLLKAKNEAIQTTRPKHSISSPKIPSQSKRLVQLKQIARRTKEMNLTDLCSLLVFRDKPSLMKWLYSLSDDWIFAIKGNLIIFDITDDDKKESTTKISEVIKEPEQKKQCLYCEAKLVDVEDEGPIVCLNCGKKAPYCEVCKNIIIAGEKIVQVTPCNHIFHKNHIL